jgi:ABC-2 type transport system permease protein
VSLISTELLKLRTVRFPWLLLAVSQALIVAGVAGAILSGSDVQQASTVVQLTGHAGLASLFTLVLGIGAVAGEHRHKTITDTYLATPRRGRVVMAKLAVYTAAGAAFGVVDALTGAVASAVALAAKGASLDLSNAALWRTLLGAIAWNAAFAAIGVGVGALIRNLAGAIATALAWVALVEGIVGQLLGDLRRWLPLASGTALGNLPSASGSPTALPQWGAGLALAGYALVLAVVAVSTTVRRDVS